MVILGPGRGLPDHICTFERFDRLDQSTLHRVVVRDKQISILAEQRGQIIALNLESFMGSLGVYRDEVVQDVFDRADFLVAENGC